MKMVLIMLSLFISMPIAAQNWAAIGVFNRGLTTFYEDTLADEMYIGGNFTYFDSDTLVGISRWDGISMTTLGCGIEWDCLNPGMADYTPPVNGIMRFNGNTFVTGGFSKAGGLSVDGLAEWDGTQWRGFGTGLQIWDGSMGIGFGLNVIDNELYVFGVFDSVSGNQCNSCAKWNGINWNPIHDLPLISPNSGGINRIYSIVQYSNDLYCGGVFHNDSMEIYNITKWNGSDWVSVGDGIRGGMIYINEMLVYHNDLIVAGMFTKEQNALNPGNYIAKWNGTQWSELGDGLDGVVWDMKINNDELYVCGAFQHAGGIDADKIAKWDGTKWCGFGTSIDNVVNTIGFYHDSLYIGGGFWTINGDSIGRIAKWVGGDYTDTCGIESGIEQVVNIETLTVFPNPLHTTATIVLPFELITGTLKFYNLLGQEVMSIEGITGKEILISRDGLSNGLYFFRVTDGQVLIGQGKIVVE